MIATATVDLPLDGSYSRRYRRALRVAKANGWTLAQRSVPGRSGVTLVATGATVTERWLRGYVLN
jgi:hypothetical protein